MAPSRRIEFMPQNYPTIRSQDYIGIFIMFLLYVFISVHASKFKLNDGGINIIISGLICRQTKFYVQISHLT